MRYLYLKSEMKYHPHKIEGAETERDTAIGVAETFLGHRIANTTVSFCL
jgi:hypothetical protein